jgi:hypothetical protein
MREATDGTFATYGNRDAMPEVIVRALDGLHDVMVDVTS